MCWIEISDFFLFRLFLEFFWGEIVRHQIWRELNSEGGKLLTCLKLALKNFDDKGDFGSANLLTIIITYDKKVIEQIKF